MPSAVARPCRCLVAALAAFTVLAAVPAAAADCPLFVLKRTEDGVTIERTIIREGRTQALLSTPESGLITVILPPGPGGSGSLERLAEGRVFTARCAGDEIRVESRAGEDDGAGYARPVQRLGDLRGYTIHVSVVGSGGLRAAFVIDGYADVRADELTPVIDIFGDRLPFPLDDGDYLVFTDTFPSRPGPPARGEADLQHFVQEGSAAGHLMVPTTAADGTAAWYLIDTAAAATVLAEAALPGDVEIRDAARIQHSEKGAQRLEYAVTGATGQVGGFLGAATLPELRLGSITFRDVEAMVMEGLFTAGGRRVVGILGQDLLRRADIVTIEYGRNGAPGRLRLADVPELAGGAAEFRFSPGRLNLFTKGAINDHPAHFVIDTGAPVTLTTGATARAVELRPEDGPTRTRRGLDGEGAEFRPAAARSVRLEEVVIEDVAVEVGPLAVFDTIADGQSTAILGNDVLSRFRRVEIDYPRGVIRLAG